MSHFTLTIAIQRGNEYFLEVKVFDAINRCIDLQKDHYINDKVVYTTLLPKGVYILRAAMLGCIEDTTVILNENKDYLITNSNNEGNKENIVQMPPIYSSAVFSSMGANNYDRSIDLYAKKALLYSQSDTLPVAFIDKKKYNSSLLVFLRYASVDRYKQLEHQARAMSIISMFSLLDMKGKKVVRFEDTAAMAVDEDSGWLAFSAILQPGTYYLVYKGRKPRQIPIYVFDKWHTQCFMIVDKEPVFGSFRTFFSEKREFDAGSLANQYADILLNKVLNCDFVLDRELIEAIANRKYESPVLGILGAYIYLRSGGNLDDSLFRRIVDNLTHDIFRNNTNAPDLRALNLMAASHFKNYPRDTRPIVGTPMFRIGFEAIMTGAARIPSLVPPYSMNSFISETLYYDTPFNTFEPINFDTVAESGQLQPGKEGQNNPESDVDHSGQINPPYNSRIWGFQDLSNKTGSAGTPANHKFRMAENIGKTGNNKSKATSPLFDDNNLDRSLSSIIGDKNMNAIMSKLDSRKKKTWLENAIVDALKEDFEKARTYSTNIRKLATQLNMPPMTISRVLSKYEPEQDIIIKFR